MKASQNWRGERGAKETSGTPLWNLKNPEFTAFWLFFLVVYNVRMLLHGGGGGGGASGTLATCALQHLRKVFASGVVLHISYFFFYFVSILVFFPYEDHTVLLLYKIFLCFSCPAYVLSVLPDNSYLSLGNRLHFRGPTPPVIAVATSGVGPAVLLFVEEVCQVLRFETNSVPRYQ